MNILLVDDEYISNFINRKLIENIDASIQIMDFNNPEAAYEQLPVIKPDLIFLDINMPVMSGWDFLTKMKKDKLAYKVIILTSSVNSMDRKMAATFASVIGFVEKPATIAAIAPYLAQFADVHL